ncbi:type IV pilus modification PilV family protein [Motiliproteus sediminis]|uniref:type IV pilus modification PilV family protein n=1 Tax=Motiliproteus sediminis TaxID=1468178 RepID=UPI001AF00CB6|nr:prepilin-type N-terminal cleavage/methylation domain-containing protein [Motiliproteus sediminis]
MPTERGFTLVELVLAIAIVSIALLFVVMGVKRGGEQGNSALWQAKAVELANALMDEIHSKRYDENSALDSPCKAFAVSASLPDCSVTLGRDGAETRAVYNDSDDIHGFNTVDGGDTLEDLLGNDLESLRRYAGYGVSVAVGYAGGDFGRPTEDLKRITIDIFPPGQDNAVRFSAYRGNY